MRQNEAHGLLLRVNVFLSAYFKYRTIAVMESEHSNFAAQEEKVKEALLSFMEGIQAGPFQKYSRITWALFVQTLRQFVTSVQLPEATLDILSTNFDNMIQQTFTDANLSAGGSISLEQQSYLEELLSVRLEVLTQLHRDEHLVNFVKAMTLQFMRSNIDLTYVFL